MANKQMFQPIDQNWAQLHSGNKKLLPKGGQIVKSKDLDPKQTFQKFTPQMFDRRSNSNVEVIHEDDGRIIIRFECNCGCESVVELQTA